MRITWTKNLLYLLGFITFFGANAQKTVIDEVIAVVGKNAIFLSDFEQQLVQYETQGIDVTPKLKSKVLEELLVQQLLVHKADIDSIVIDEFEIDSEVENRLKYFEKQIGGRDQLEAYFKKSVAEIKDEMRGPLEDQMKSQRAKWAVMEGISITPAEINRYFYGITKDSLPVINDQVEIGQILRFPPANITAVTETKRKLKDLKERVLSGESFETLAILYSEDPGSSRNGGLYESVKRGMFVKEFEAVMFSLKVNEISDVFKTEYGYHIVQLVARNGEQVDLRHILISPKIGQDDLLETRDFLDSLKTIIEEEDITFKEAAIKFSDDVKTKNNGGILINDQVGSTFFELEKMDRTLSTAIEGLEMDDISTPMYVKMDDGKEAYRILYIKNRKEKHIANLKDDYQRIQGMALSDKQSSIMKNWANRMISETYIMISGDYSALKFNYNWNK